MTTGCGEEKKQPEEGKQVLNLFSWADNFDPEVIKAFEKKYNCKVNYDVFANNEELLAKLQAGGAQYDLIQRKCPKSEHLLWKSWTKRTSPIPATSGTISSIPSSIQWENSPWDTLGG